MNNQHQLHQQLQQQLQQQQQLINQQMMSQSSSLSSPSPKKTIIQKYNEDLDDMVIKTYTTRLVLTWIYNNPNPPILSPLPKLKVIPSCKQQNQQSNNYNQILKTSTHTFVEIENYVKDIYDLWETVLSFFYSQHIKRSKTYYQNVKQSPSNTESDQTVKLTLKSIIIASIYYSDLFFRKSCINNSNSSKSTKNQNFTILDIVISSINLSIKMWLEEKMSVNKYLSEIFGVSLVHVNSLERYFINLIDYQLYLHEKDIQSFANIIHKSYVNKSSTLSSNSNNNSNNNNNNTQQIIENENCANKISIQVYSNSSNNNSFNQHDNSANSSPLTCSIGGSSSNNGGVCSSSSSYISESSSSSSSSSTSSPSVLVVPSSPTKSSFIHHSISSSTASSSSTPSPSSISPKKRYLSISRSSLSASSGASSSSSNTNTPTTSSPSTCTVPNSIHHDDYQDQPKKRIKAIVD